MLKDTAMRVTPLRLILACALGILTGCAAVANPPPKEQSALAISPPGPPVWKPGYEWGFRWESPQGKGTFVWTVNREEIVDGMAYYVVTAGRQREMYWQKADLAFYLDKVRGQVERRYIPPQHRYMWPLTPGKTWEDTFIEELPLDHQTIELALRCQVETEETLTVPAGTFRAFKIVCRHPGAIGSEIWYAPEVKQWIRDREPSAYGIRERELISFKLD
jgi:hypothetical protein